MKILFALIAGILSCFFLAYYGAQTRRDSIQEDLWNRAANALVNAPVERLVITADGREITLRGIVPDEQAKQDAARSVERTSGVHGVTNLLEIRSAQAANPPVGSEGQNPAARCQQEITQAMSREQIEFQPSWYAIQAASFPLLDHLAEILNTCPTAKVEISGHTDAYGILENNMALSRNRAQEVANYLIAKGTQAARLVVVGHGPNKPIADNATPEGMKKNRRIEFTVTAS